LHGGIKVYRGDAAAARHYVEADRSRADDYYLAEGTGVAECFVADGRGVRHVEPMNGDAYERWVAGYDPVTGVAKGRLRTDDQAVRFIEVTVNGPKSWSLAAALYPEVAEAYDAAQERALMEITGWLAGHATTRVGPRGRQVQVAVERLEVAGVRHYTSRAGDPHRHIHLQISARVWAMGKWRAIHTVGLRDALDAINGIGHAAVMCDPGFREALAARGLTTDSESGEIEQLKPFVGPFSARAAQITRNTDRYEATWRADHPSEEPGPGLRRAWDTRAWKEARPDKVVPLNGEEVTRGWVDDLIELGYCPRASEAPSPPTRPGALDRNGVVTTVLTRLGRRRSAWNLADVRGEVEQQIAKAGIVADTLVRTELAEDLTSRAVAECVPLLAGEAVPGHVRHLTSPSVLEVEADLTNRFARRAASGGVPSAVAAPDLDVAQKDVADAIAGSHPLLVVEGAAGAGKTTTLRAVHVALREQRRRLVVVAPTLKAAEVAQREIGASSFTASWLARQYGFRWNDDGLWKRVHRDPPTHPSAWLRKGDVLLVDEGAMLDQDLARALLTIADDTRARLVLMGDRHQLPAVGRGGVLDLAIRHGDPEAHLALTKVHRFSDPEYAELSLLMRSGSCAGEVFDRLLERGQIRLHATEVERCQAVAEEHAGGLPTDRLLIADTRQQVSQLNAAVRDLRLAEGLVGNDVTVTTDRGERIGPGDRVATRQNDPEQRVANRDLWTVAEVNAGGVRLRGRVGQRDVTASYAREHLELAYATTVHGCQGETVGAAVMVVGENTGARSAYVGMTRGRNSNTAHLLADSVADARRQWVAAFERAGADLGPAHAASTAASDVERYGPQPPAFRRAAMGQAGPYDLLPTTDDERHRSWAVGKPSGYAGPAR